MCPLGRYAPDLLILQFQSGTRHNQDCSAECVSSTGREKHLALGIRLNGELLSFVELNQRDAQIQPGKTSLMFFKCACYKMLFRGHLQLCLNGCRIFNVVLDLFALTLCIFFNV